MKRFVFVLLMVMVMSLCLQFSLPAADEEWKVQKQLYDAILKDDIKAMEPILAANPSLVNKEIKFHNLPILDAAGAGSVKALKFLVEKGADIKKLESETGNSVLHLAATSRKPNKETREALFDYLINEKKIDVNLKNKKGETPLVYSFTFSRFLPASKTGIENIEVFEKFKADLNAQNETGKTSLNYIVSNLQIKDPAAPDLKPLEMAKVLIEKGADVNIADKDKRTPLVSFLVCTGKVADEQKIEFVTLLMEHGAKTNLKSKKKEDPLKLVDKKSKLYEVMKKKYKKK